MHWGYYKQSHLEAKFADEFMRCDGGKGRLHQGPWVSTSLAVPFRMGPQLFHPSCPMVWHVISIF